jgi:hypothetical protein
MFGLLAIYLLRSLVFRVDRVVEEYTDVRANCRTGMDGIEASLAVRVGRAPP